MTADQNVARVVAKLKHRSAVGLKKYGVPTDRAGLSRQDWLRHLQEELLDAAVYVEQLLGEEPAEAIRAAQADALVDAARHYDEQASLSIRQGDPDAAQRQQTLSSELLYRAAAIRGQGD